VLEKNNNLAFLRYPKCLPTALADYVEENKLQGNLKFNLLVGASVSEAFGAKWRCLQWSVRLALKRKIDGLNWICTHNEKSDMSFSLSFNVG
jgi:hypothetical protein